MEILKERWRVFWNWNLTAYSVLKKKWLFIKTWKRKITFITHGFRVSVVSDVRERVRDLGSPMHFMLRRSSLVHSWPCLFHINWIICERQRALYGIKCVLRIFWQTWLHILIVMDKKNSTHCKHVPCNKNINISKTS
jgi:hypothetical protein